MSLTLTLPLDVPVRPMDAEGLRVWVGIVHIELDFFFFSFHGSMKKFNQLAKKKTSYLKFFSLA